MEPLVGIQWQLAIKMRLSDTFIGRYCSGGELLQRLEAQEVYDEAAAAEAWYLSRVPPRLNSASQTSVKPSSELSSSLCYDASVSWPFMQATSQMLQAVNYLHAHSIVHRDLKLAHKSEKSPCAVEPAATRGSSRTSSTTLVGTGTDTCVPLAFPATRGVQQRATGRHAATSAVKCAGYSSIGIWVDFCEVAAPSKESAEKDALLKLIDFGLCETLEDTLAKQEPGAGGRAGGPSISPF